MATPGGKSGRYSQQKEAEEYLSRIKLREIFQVLCHSVYTYVMLHHKWLRYVTELYSLWFHIVQGMLTHVVVHQPEDPIAYFHEELSKIKKEVEENNVSIPSTNHICTCHLTIIVLLLHSFFVGRHCLYNISHFF